MIVLAHLWVLTPLALAWFLFPAWRGDGVSGVTRQLAVLALIATAYLLIRTWLTVKSSLTQWRLVWPFVDVALITAALVLLRNPNDALFALYFIPLASAVASLRTEFAVGLAAAAAAGYLLGVQITGELWSVRTLFRVAIIGVMASLYGWIVRIVGLFERTAERAEVHGRLVARPLVRGALG